MAGSKPSIPTIWDAQDMFYVGTLKVVGRICRQTFNDTYSKLTCAKLCLAIEDIDHTLLQEFYQVAFHKKIYHSLDELQADG